MYGGSDGSVGAGGDGGVGWWWWRGCRVVVGPGCRVPRDAENETKNC